MPSPDSYADAIATYLAFAVDKMTTTNSAICTWQTQPTRLVAAFSRQVIPMVWDYAEANPFSEAAGDYKLGIASVIEVLERLPLGTAGEVNQKDATNFIQDSISNSVISTDPPYYDNIGYADLSDYFYIWLRHSLIDFYPDLFSTVLVPKAHELVATPFRFERSKEKATKFFEDGLSRAFNHIHGVQDPSYPLTIFMPINNQKSVMKIFKMRDWGSCLLAGKQC
jgi:putative DNA methylase